MDGVEWIPLRVMLRLQEYLLFLKLLLQMKCECECRGAELEEAKLRCQGREGVSFWDTRWDFWDSWYIFRGDGDIMILGTFGFGTLGNVRCRTGIKIFGVDFFGRLVSLLGHEGWLFV